jgi:hypothetical protein
MADIMLKEILIPKGMSDNVYRHVNWSLANPRELAGRSACTTHHGNIVGHPLIKILSQNYEALKNLVTLHISRTFIGLLAYRLNNS